MSTELLRNWKCNLNDVDGTILADELHTAVIHARHATASALFLLNREGTYNYRPFTGMGPLNTTVVFCLGRAKKSLLIAKNHPKISQEFSEQFGRSIHKMKGFSKKSCQKFRRTSPKTWEDKFLGIPFLAPICHSYSPYSSEKDIL